MAPLIASVVSYVLSLAMVYVLALIIDALAPSFDGTRDQLKALKVAVYANTAGWVAGILMLLPALSIIAVLGGLYGLYLLYLGLPTLMKAPREKALGYTAVTVIVAIGLSILVGLVTASVGGLAVLGGGPAFHLGSAAPGGTIALQVTDMGGAAGLAAMAGAFNVQANKTTANGYEKVGNVGGRMTTERWDGSSKAGNYAVMVASRFMVSADGQGASMDELKSAVGAVDFGALEGLAR